MKTNKKAFTIIEMSIVMILMGVFIAVTVNFYAKSVLSRKYKDQTEENKKMTSIIDTYSKKYKHLPDNASEIMGIWSKKDTFNNVYEYALSKRLQNSDICNFNDNTSLSIKYCDTPDCSSFSKQIHDLAYILISKGLNATADYVRNENGNNIEYQIYRQSGESDDIISFYHLDELKEVLECADTHSPDRLKFLNTDLVPLLINNRADNMALIIAGGGTKIKGKNYEWCADNYQPITKNFVASDIYFYVEDNGKQFLSNIAGADCFNDDGSISADFILGGNKLMITYDNTTTSDNKPASFSFIAHIMDAKGTVTSNTFLLQMY